MDGRRYGFSMSRSFINAVDELGYRYARFLRAGELLSRVVRWPKSRRIIFRLLGRGLSPFVAHRKRLKAAIQSATGCSRQDADVVVRDWLASHGLFLEIFFRYRSLTPQFLSQEVQIDDPMTFARAVGTGGVILSYHCHHQNTLTALFGLAGATISPLAASEKSSSLYSVIGPYIHRVNDDSAIHFCGGRYLFVDRERESLRISHRALVNGELVLALCDQHASEVASPLLSLFNRRIAPPVGAMRLALRLNVPCYAAILFPKEKSWQLYIRQLPVKHGLEALAQSYLAALEDWVRVEPSAWQGWDWFLELPLDDDLHDKNSA